MLFTVVAKLKVRTHTLSEVADKLDYMSRVQIKPYKIHFGEMDYDGRASVVWEKCNTVLIWSSRNVLWTSKLNWPFYRHGDD